MAQHGVKRHKASQGGTAEEEGSVMSKQAMAYRLPDVCEQIGLKSTKVREMIASGELPSIRVGRAVLVPHTDLQTWLEKQRREQLRGKSGRNATGAAVNKPRRKRP
jgi:excisionase family DNA binding protein